MKLEEVNTQNQRGRGFPCAALESGHSEVLTHTSEQWRSFTPTASATSCSSHVRSPMLPTLPDFRHGTRLAASSNGEKKAFSFSPRWSARRSTKDIATDRDRNDDATTEGQRTLYGFRAVYVFDISQTEGKELPTLTEVNGDVSGYRERLFKFVESQNVELSFSERIAPAKGLSYGGKITLLSGMQPAEEFSTLVHEIAHEMLHRGDRRTLTTKQVRETEAEAVAFVVCQSVGLQNGTASAGLCRLRSYVVPAPERHAFTGFLPN